MRFYLLNIKEYIETCKEKLHNRSSHYKILMSFCLANLHMNRIVFISNKISENQLKNENA